MKSCKGISIISSNPDLGGRWNRVDVEQEMLDLEIPISDEQDWIRFVLDHDFDNCLDQDIINAIINPAVRDMRLVLENDSVTIVKWFNDYPDHSLQNYGN